MVDFEAPLIGDLDSKIWQLGKQLDLRGNQEE